MTWRCPGDKPLSEPIMIRLWTHICVTWPQRVKFRCHRFSCVTHKSSLNICFSIIIWLQHSNRNTRHDIWKDMIMGYHNTDSVYIILNCSIFMLVWKLSNNVKFIMLVASSMLIVYKVTTFVLVRQFASKKNYSNNYPFLHEWHWLKLPYAVIISLINDGFYSTFSNLLDVAFHRSPYFFDILQGQCIQHCGFNSSKWWDHTFSICVLLGISYVVLYVLLMQY